MVEGLPPHLMIFITTERERKKKRQLNAYGGNGSERPTAAAYRVAHSQQATYNTTKLYSKREPNDLAASVALPVHLLSAI